MGKYTPPPVTMRDVLEALPPVKSPLSFTVAVNRAGILPGRCYPYVALGIDRRTGWYGEYKRWGRECRSDDTATVMRHLLLAAQEAYLWVEGKDADELVRLVSWQLDVPR